eukprot:TRINITY_DN14280_c0_g1_i1.p1 TRINITY_DN14280_c0_g1~~TRINITY_DN14280_c0_g1_i1.p1  ORF type:complete len:310 (-),score=34.37 TRINITY_DN14280_c0_g1_i1:3-932(-)
MCIRDSNMSSVELDDEIWLQVLLLVVKKPKDISMLGLVSWKWNTLSENNILWLFMFRTTLILAPSSQPIIAEYLTEEEEYLRPSPKVQGDLKRRKADLLKILQNSRPRFEITETGVINSENGKKILIAAGDASELPWHRVYRRTVEYIIALGNCSGGSFGSPNVLSPADEQQLRTGADACFADKIKFGKVLYNSINNLDTQEKYEQWIYHIRATDGSNAAIVASTIHLQSSTPFAYSIRNPGSRTDEIKFVDPTRQKRLQDNLHQDCVRSLDAILVALLANRMSSCGISPELGRYCIYWDEKSGKISKT